MDPGTVDANACPECGAVLPPGETCRARFEWSLEHEFEDWEGYGAVHDLSGAAYLLQHPGGYSIEALRQARQVLSGLLEDERPPAELRRENRRRLDSKRRTWRMAGRARVTLRQGATWTRTIADVRLDDAAVYCDDVREWARAVLADTA